MWVSITNWGWSDYSDKLINLATGALSYSPHSYNTALVKQFPILLFLLVKDIIRCRTKVSETGENSNKLLLNSKGVLSIGETGGNSQLNSVGHRQKQRNYLTLQSREGDQEILYRQQLMFYMMIEWFVDFIRVLVNYLPCSFVITFHWVKFSSVTSFFQFSFFVLVIWFRLF